MTPLWPHRLLGIAPDAPLTEAFAAHARRVAALRPGPHAQMRKERLDAALAWCQAHWIEGSWYERFRPAGQAGPRPSSTRRASAQTALVPVGGVALPARVTAAPERPRVALLEGPVPAARVVCAGDAALRRRAIAAYREAAAAQRAAPVHLVEFWA